MVTRVVLSLLALPNWLGGLVLAAWSATIWLAARRLKLAEAERLAWQWLLSYDQHANALAFGNKDEYISTRAGRCARKGGTRPCHLLCRALHLLDPDHCEKSIEADRSEATGLLDEEDEYTIQPRQSQNRP